MPPLTDCIPHDALILFVGINPGRRSGELGHHFAGPGNPFWRLLHAAGLTDVPLPAAEDHRLPEFGLGLTNLCPRPTRSAAELTAAEIAAGRRALDRNIERFRPRVVAFVGLSIYCHFFGHARSGGAGAKPERLHGAPLFVVPNPSGLNASFPGFQSKLEWFVRLREFALQRRDAAPGAGGERRGTLERRQSAGSDETGGQSSSPPPAGQRKPSGGARRKGR